MSITNRVISDICRTKYGNAVDVAVRNLDIRDVEDMIENISWGKAEDMYQRDRRYQDVDHAYSDLSRAENEYRSIVGFSAMVIIGMALDVLPWFKDEYDRDLPRQLMEDADQAYRGVLRDAGAQESNNEPATSGYRAGQDKHEQRNPRLGNNLNKGKYAAQGSNGGFANRAKQQKAEPRYEGGSGGFAERMRGDINSYEPAPIAVAEPEVVTVQVPAKVYANPKELLAFNINTGEYMESYDMHEIKATKTKHVGVDLPISKLVVLSASSDAEIQLVPSESVTKTELDPHPSELLALPLHKSISGVISTSSSLTETQFTLATGVTDELIESFKINDLFELLNMLDTYKDWISSVGYPNDLMAYLTTILSRSVSQMFTLGLGTPVTILPNPGDRWTIAIDDLDLPFDSISEGIRELLNSKTYSWGEAMVEELINAGYMSSRFDIGVSGAELDDVQESLVFSIKQTRTIINAPGHLDTNISHIDNGDVVEVTRENNQVFSTALRCISDKLKETARQNGSVVLVDDFGYALEFVTAYGGHKLFVQRHMTY